jgi:hypothetical protein
VKSRRMTIHEEPQDENGYTPVAGAVGDILQIRIFDAFLGVGYQEHIAEELTGNVQRMPDELLVCHPSLVGKSFARCQPARSKTRTTCTSAATDSLMNHR